MYANQQTKYKCSDEGLRAEQNDNADETSLYWRYIKRKTYVIFNSLLELPDDCPIMLLLKSCSA
jgi:membrane-bound inhibitor of C-type lysozyme